MSKSVVHLFALSGGWVIYKCIRGGSGGGTWELNDVTCKRCNGTDMRYSEFFRNFIKKTLEIRTSQ